MAEEKNKKPASPKTKSAGKSAAKRPAKSKAKKSEKSAGAKAGAAGPSIRKQEAVAPTERQASRVLKTKAAIDRNAQDSFRGGSGSRPAWEFLLVLPAARQASSFQHDYHPRAGGTHGNQVQRAH